MTKDEAKQLWEQVKAKGAALDACAGHDFVDTTPEKIFNKVYRCSRCGGECGSVERMFYERGVAHGRAAVAAERAS